MMPPLRIHLRRSVFLVAAPVLAVGGFFLAAGSSYPFVTTHGDIAAAMVSTSAVLCPLLAGIAAWDGIREDRNGGAPLLDSAYQPRSRVVLAQAISGMIYATVVVVAIVVALYLRGAVLHTVIGGASVALQLLVTLTVCVIATTLGYIVAGLLRHWVAVIVAIIPPIVIYGLTFTRLDSVLAGSLIPFGNRTGLQFFDPNSWFFVGQLIFLLGIVVALSSSMMLIFSRDRWASIAMAVAGVTMITGGIVTIDKQAGVWATEATQVSDRLRAFRSADGALTLRLLPHYAPIADDLLDTWSRVRSIFVDTPWSFSDLSQAGDSHPIDQRPTLTTIYLNPNSTMPAPESVQASLIDVLPTDCRDGATVDYILVTFWLAGPGSESTSQLRTEDREALEALRALSVDESAAWMREHFTEFATCSIERSSFPAR